MGTKICSVVSIDSEFEGILETFSEMPSFQLALSRCYLLGKLTGQLGALTSDAKAKYKIDFPNDNGKAIKITEVAMSVNDFIANLKNTEKWDEAAYLAWVAATSPAGTDLQKRSQYLVSIGAAVPIQQVLDDFVEEHSGSESPDEPIMGLIIYQMYLKWLVWVKGCDYC